MNMCWQYINTNNNVCVIEVYNGSNPLRFVRSVIQGWIIGESLTRVLGTL
jgi:hypothetical protein